jgi:hypothetical protein
MMRTDAKAQAEKLAAGEKSGKRKSAPEPQPSTPHSHVVGAGEDGESPARSQSASPFSYVRRQLAGVSAKAKGAQRNKAAPKPGPKATSAAGGKRKSTGGGGDSSLSSKQAELRQQNEEVFNTLDSTIEQIKVGFSTGTLDKSLLNTLAENCKRAIGFFAKPKHLDTKKLERLNCISGPLEAMKGFATTAAKKSSAQAEFTAAFAVCSKANVVVPSEYVKKAARCAWDGEQAQKNYSGALRQLVEQDLTADECADMFDSSFIARFSKCKPAKQPESQEMLQLQEWVDGMTACADESLKTLGTTNEQQARVTRLQASVRQMKVFKPVFDCIGKTSLSVNIGVLDSAVPHFGRWLRLQCVPKTTRFGS